MRRRILAHIKGNVVAYLALFVALGGTSAYAANTIRSSDIVDNEVGSADVKDNSINTFDVHSFLGVDVVDGTLTGDDLASSAWSAWVGRGLLNCNGPCTIFDLRPQGFTDNAEPGAFEKRPFRSPPGGLRVSDWAATLSSAVPSGQNFVMWLIEFSTPNVFLSCTITGPASSCTSPGTATIPAGTLFWVAINTSYQETRAPYLDFSFRARPAS